MDFGWKKADPADQNNTPVVQPQQASSLSSNGNAATSSLANAPMDKLEDATSPSKPLPVPTEPGQVAIPEVKNAEPQFEMSRREDSFSDDITIESVDKESQSDKISADAPSVSNPFTMDPPSIAEGSDPVDTTPDKEDNKLSEPIALDANENIPEKIEENIVTPIIPTGNSSLSDLEKKISAQKDEVNKKLADLQTQSTKFEDLLSKVQKMQVEEQSLIAEISSSL